MTVQELRSFTVKDLGQMAKAHDVAGWHGMRKEDLVRVLSRKLRRKARASVSKAPASKAPASKMGTAKAKSARVSTPPKSKPQTSAARTSRASGRSNSNRSNSNGSNSKGASSRRQSPATSSAMNGHAANGAASNGAALNGAGKKLGAKAAESKQRVHQAQHRQKRRKDLSTERADHAEGNGNGRIRDRLVVLVRDPYWLQAYWELSRQTVQRAQAAMGQAWHSAKPVLRVHEVCRGEGTSSVDSLLRDIPIHGGVNNWYVDVKDPPKSYRLEIGYRAENGKFFTLARSNVVTTPRAAASDALDNNWHDVAENFEKIYALNGGASESGASVELEELFEERLRRPLNVSTFSSRPWRS